MNKEQAYKIGLAFKLGMIYARGKAYARKLTTDKAEWITVHPNGKENKGRPALIDSTTGQVLGGMGGKFNGQHISIANSKSNKPALLNNQKMGFYDVEKEQDKTSDQYFAQYTDAKLDMDEVQRNQSFIEDINKGDFNSLDDTVQFYEKYKDLGKIVTPKNVYEFKGGKWQDKNGNTVNENMSNRIWDEFKEFKKSSDYGSTEHANKVENEYLLSRGKELDPKTVEKIEKKKEQREKLLNELSKSNDRTHSQYMGNVTRRNKVNKLDKEIKDLETKLRNKGTEERTNANKKPAGNQIANTTNTYINNIQNEINKAKGDNETLSKLKTNATVRKVLENVPDGTILHSQRGGFLRKEKDGSFSALNDQGELVSKNMPLKIDDLYDSSNNWSIGIGKTTQEAQQNTTSFRLDNTVDIGNSKRTEEQKQQAKQDYFKKYENSFKDSDGHTTAGLNDIDFDKAVKAFNNSSQDPERRAKVLRQDYVSSVNNMYDDLKGRIENKEQQEYLNKEFEKGKQQILKAYNDYLSSESQTASTSVVGKMRSALQARKMNEKQNLAFEKRANIANIVEKIQEKIGNGLWERNNKNLERRNNNNNYLSNVLNKPITNWNGKIYSYKNGEKAVFINNQKIVLNDAQYKKLKEFAGK